MPSALRRPSPCRRSADGGDGGEKYGDMWRYVEICGDMWRCSMIFHDFPSGKFDEMLCGSVWHLRFIIYYDVVHDFP